jgi:hypothetical protein
MKHAIPLIEKTGEGVIVDRNTVNGWPSLREIRNDMDAIFLGIRMRQANRA